MTGLILPSNRPKGRNASQGTRRSIWRRLTLTDPDGRVFLERRGIELLRFGVYVHRIDAPDPGIDLHDHPWPFATVILRGGYTEQYALTDEAVSFATMAEAYPKSCLQGQVRTWQRWSFHRMPLDVAHRIAAAQPGTLTLVLRGRRSRSWGFYQPEGWVDWQDYDYAGRRGGNAVGSYVP